MNRIEDTSEEDGHMYLPYERMRISQKCVKLESCGEGGFGSVDAYYDHRFQKIIAVKKLAKYSNYLQEKRRLIKLKKEQLEFVNDLIGYCDEERTLVFELGEATLLEIDDILQQEGHAWNEIELVYIVWNLLKGLKFLRQIDSFHGDISPNNIMFFMEKLKYIDLGSSEIKKNTSYLQQFKSEFVNHAIKRNKQSYRYTDSEITQNEMFSLGKTILYLALTDLADKKCFVMDFDKKNHKLMAKLQQEQLSQIRDNFSLDAIYPFLKGIILRMMYPYDKIENNKEDITEQVERREEKLNQCERIKKQNEKKDRNEDRVVSPSIKIQQNSGGVEKTIQLVTEVLITNDSLNIDEQDEQDNDKMEEQDKQNIMSILDEVEESLREYLLKECGRQSGFSKIIEQSDQIRDAMAKVRRERMDALVESHDDPQRELVFLSTMNAAEWRREIAQSMISDVLSSQQMQGGDRRHLQKLIHEKILKIQKRILEKQLDIEDSFIDAIKELYEICKRNREYHSLIECVFALYLVYHFLKLPDDAQKQLHYAQQKAELSSYAHAYDGTITKNKINEANKLQKSEASKQETSNTNKQQNSDINQQQKAESNGQQKSEANKQQNFDSYKQQSADMQIIQDLVDDQLYLLRNDLYRIIY